MIKYVPVDVRRVQHGEQVLLDVLVLDPVVQAVEGQADVVGEVLDLKGHGLLAADRGTSF